jgi:regulator of cell morphogenesis and NO signaling
MSARTETSNDIASESANAIDLVNEDNSTTKQHTHIGQAISGSNINWEAQSPIKLIAHIIDNFHEKHRMQFQQLIQLTKAVKLKNTDHCDYPHHLESHLSQMKYELEEHMMKEEAILFPMIMKGYYPSGPISVMEAEHLEHEKALDKLTTLTNKFTPPHDADEDWQRLYAKIHELYNDLNEHIHLENNILFMQG